MPTQVEWLLMALGDQRLDFGERDDVALALGAYDDPRVVRELARVASDPEEDPALSDSCGDSLGEIWCRMGHYDPELVAGLQEPARILVLAYFEDCHPEWVESVRAIWSRADGPG